MEFLACEDLGDEWADFIGVNSQAQLKTVTFYHAKHGTHSLSAGAFRASVGQAIKNPRHLLLTPESLDPKIEKRNATYNNEGHQTQIPRMLKGIRLGQPRAQLVAICLPVRFQLSQGSRFHHPSLAEAGGQPRSFLHQQASTMQAPPVRQQVGINAMSRSST